MTSSCELILYTHNKPIGKFCSKADTYPDSAGWYTFEPYRGEGHMLLVQALESDDTLAAWFFDGNIKRHFEIDGESFDVDRTDGQWQVHILKFESQ